MKRRWISAIVLSGFVLLGTQGFCRESVRRPVTSFLDFYEASKHARVPPTFLERVVLGIAIAAKESTGPLVTETQSSSALTSASTTK